MVLSSNNFNRITRYIQCIVTQYAILLFCNISLANCFMTVGNLILSPDIFVLFIIYLAGIAFVVSLMFLRVSIYSYLIWMVSCSSIKLLM